MGGALIVALGIWSAIDRSAPDRLWGTIRHGIPTIGIIAVAVYTQVVVFALLYQEVGRFDAVYIMAVGMATLIVGLSVMAPRFGHMPYAIADRGQDWVA